MQQILFSSLQTSEVTAKTTIHPKPSPTSREAEQVPRRTKIPPHESHPSILPNHDRKKYPT
jgi:hypothetical protein